MTSELVIDIVAGVHGFAPDDITVDKGRKLQLVRARNHAMWELKKQIRMTYDEIANDFGYLGKDRHTGALHGVCSHTQELLNGVDSVIEKHNSASILIDKIIHSKSCEY